MADLPDSGRLTGRRDFLWQVSAAATAAHLALGRGATADDRTAAATMPTIQLGSRRISRIVAGWNPIGGGSHTTIDMRRAMREYFTVDRIVEFLQNCERNGISAWQFDHKEYSVEAIRRIRQQGSKLALICLHAERKTDVPIRKVVEDTAPMAMVYHGCETDARFREGKQVQIRDFLKKVHDQGMLAGVSSHYPEYIRRIADEGWEADFFMCCFYCVFRTKEEQMKLMGRTLMHECYLENDPVEMTRVMRGVKQPCLGFKVLAAGRACWKKPILEEAFRFALANIKPNDGVIVGMFPRYSDEVTEDAGYVRKFGQLDVKRLEKPS